MGGGGGDSNGGDGDGGEVMVVSGRERPLRS